MTRTQTVTFNVGGEKFQVARSLLDFYPGSVLAKSISERWQQEQDPDEDIFFDRCPELFRHVLEYLRNGKVHLPITMAKKAVICELEHYCVDDVEEEAIDDSLTRRAQLVQSMKDTEAYLGDFDAEVSRLNVAIELLNAEISRSKNEKKQHQESVHAVEAAKSLLKTFRSDPTNQSDIIWTRVVQTSYSYPLLIKINEYLARVGLKVERGADSWAGSTLHQPNPFGFCGERTQQIASNIHTVHLSELKID